MSEWEPIYPEEIQWQDKPTLTTPLAARLLNKMDHAIKVHDDRILNLNRGNIFDLLEANWVATGVTPYAYTYTISTTKYTDDSIPVCQVCGVNDMETDAEITSESYIEKVKVTSTTITVYASDKPTVDLKLVIKG